MGVAVLRFDFTGLGNSGADFANTNFTSNIEDLIKASDYMRDHLEAPSILFGHYLGGAAVLVAAYKIPEIQALAAIGAPSDSTHVAHHFENSREEIESKGEAEVLLEGRPFTIQKHSIDDIKSQKVDIAIETLKKPLLVLHAPRDETVGIENAKHISTKAKPPKKFYILGHS